MIKKKRNFAIAMMVMSLVMGSTVVSAGGHPYSFALSGTGKQQTGAYLKNDNEQAAYITMYDTPGFSVGQDCFGFRVRRGTDNGEMTEYHNSSYLLQKYAMAYIRTANTTTPYYMRGQIDSKSATKVLNISGVWLP